MASTPAALHTLENLLTEFFNTNTTNERKHEIEAILAGLGQQHGAWQQCIYYLLNTNNHYVSMFCLTTLQGIIDRKWVGLQAEEKTEIRTTLYRFLLEKHRATPVYIRNKLVKLVVDIARLSWPHFYPDFFTNVLALSRSPDTAVLSLLFILTISEELAYPREELSYARKVELRRLLLQQVPGILNLLLGFLEGVIEKQKMTATATPPPSPTHGGTHSSSPSNSFLGQSSPAHTSSLIIQSLERCGSSCVLRSLNHESEVVASLSFKCLTHLFSWIPVSSFISAPLLNAIFALASSDALSNDYSEHSSPLNHSADLSNGIEVVTPPENLCVLAMGTINEIVDKNCVPHHFENFLLLLFTNTFNLLQKLVFPPSLPESRLQKLDADYLDKFTEFLRLFVSFHLRRFENNFHFPLIDFLALLLRFTFQQPTLDSYLNCLDVWHAFLDFLQTKSSEGSSDISKRYGSSLTTLAQGIIQKVQWRQNQAELEDLDRDIKENISDDADSVCLPEETSEWHAFLADNLELLAKIADHLPETVIELVKEPFLATSKMFLELGSSFVDHGSPSHVHHLKVASDEEYTRLHFILQDLAVLLQAVGRLSVLFLGTMLPKRSYTAVEIIHKLIDMADFSAGWKLYHIQTGAENVSSDFIEVHGHILSSLRAWVHWLSQLYGQQYVQVYPGGKQQHLHQDTCHTINKQMILVATSVIHADVPPLVFNSGVQLLLSISVLIHSPVALELEQMRNLYTFAHTVAPDIKVRKLLYRALVNFILLPWPSFIVDQRCEERKHILTSFVNSFTSDVRKLNVQDLAVNPKLREEVSVKICDTFSLLRVQVEELNGADKNSREVFFHCIDDLLQKVQLLFAVYINHSNVSVEILSLVVAVVLVLRVQLGPERVEALIQVFMEIFTTNHINFQVSIQNRTAITIVEKFLKLLELVLCEPGQSFKRFVPNTITICMDHIYPIVAERPSPEVKGPLFLLLRSLLEHNWKFFFNSSVHSSLGAGNWGHHVENEALFIKIMQAFGQSLMQPDIGIFRQNLETLELLNSKYKLYYRGIFRDMMLGQFITVLLQVLVHRSQDLLREEIIVAVYNMAAVDFNTFFNAFVPHFLQTTENLDDCQRKALKDNFSSETDIPSFMQNVQRLVNDLRYYHLCNANLPSCSMKL